MTDNDLYKFSTQCLFKYEADKSRSKGNGDIIGQYEYKCRSEHNVGLYIDDIKKEIKHLCTLKFSKKELEYLGKIYSNSYIMWLKDFQLNYDDIEISLDANRKLSIVASGRIEYVTMFEVYVLSIVSEVWAQNNIETEFDNISKYKKKLNAQIELARTCPSLRVSCMGTRRRAFGWWQYYTTSQLYKKLPDIFTGTSNVYLAMEMGIPVKGTSPHEAQCFFQAFYHINDFLHASWDAWIDMYHDKFNCVLTDTVTTRYFRKKFNFEYATKFFRIREDSAPCMKTFVDYMVKHYTDLGISPITKCIVFSNGLDIDDAISMVNYCKGKILCEFGIGTQFTNKLCPVSSVMKLTWCGYKNDMRPVAKVPDNMEKSQGGDAFHIKYVRHALEIRI